jgi:hypothetical protein
MPSALSVKAGQPQRSVLELQSGGLPFPHQAADGVWRYRHALRPEGPTALDRQAVTDFLSYESSYGRSVEIVTGPGVADWRAWPAANGRPDPAEFSVQCCTHAYPGGCSARLVCHGTPPAAAASVLREGALRCAAAVTGTPAAELAAASTWGEPPDYFEHVMLANGRCAAPEAVAASRAGGTDLVPADLKPGYVPAVRFYFDWQTLGRLPSARFDGVHPVKLHHELRLDDVLVAVVIHASHRDLLVTAAGQVSDRLAVISIDRPTPQSWATAALSAARKMA